MQVIKLNNTNKQLNNIAKLLQGGSVITCPSETSYGLTVDATNYQAIKKIYKIKGRQQGKPFLIVVSSLAMAQKYVEFNNLARKLAKKYWPGPLTLVLPATKLGLQLKGVVSQGKTIAVRLTSDKLLQSLCKKIQKPLISTSANISGQADIYSAKRIVETYQGRKSRPDLVVDGGRLKKVKPSTVAVVRGGEVEMLRLGPIVL